MKRNCFQRPNQSRALLSSLSAECRLLPESNLFSSSHVLLLLSSPTQPIAQSNTIDDHQPRGSTVLVFYRYLRHFTDQIGLPPTPGPRITHRIEHAGNRLPLFCRSTYRAGPRPAFVALLSVDSVWILTIPSALNSTFALSPFERVSLHHLPYTSIYSWQVGKHSPVECRIVPCLGSFNKLRTNTFSLRTSSLVRFKLH